MSRYEEMLRNLQNPAEIQRAPSTDKREPRVITAVEASGFPSGPTVESEAVRLAFGFAASVLASVILSCSSSLTTRLSDSDMLETRMDEYLEHYEADTMNVVTPAQKQLTKAFVSLVRSAMREAAKMTESENDDTVEPITHAELVGALLSAFHIGRSHTPETTQTAAEVIVTISNFATRIKGELAFNVGDDERMALIDAATTIAQQPLVDLTQPTAKIHEDMKNMATKLTESKQ